MNDDPADDPIGEEDEEVVLEAPVPYKGKPLSAEQQYERNQAIVAARIRRTPWSKIAKDHGLTARRCHQIFAEWRDQNPTIRDNDPIEIVDEMLYGYQGIIEDAQKTYDKAPTSGVGVGALNTKMRAYREMAELLQAIGVLPNDLGTMHLHIDGQITAERIISVLDRFHVGEEVYDGILDALGGPVKALSSGEEERPDGDA